MTAEEAKKSQTVHRALSQEELEEHMAAELPAREAMSLINTGSTVLPVYDGPTDSGLLGGTSDTTGTTGTAAGTADTATSTANETAGMAGTDAEASGTEPGTATTTSSDRSEQISQSDTAVAGPA